MRKSLILAKSNIRKAKSQTAVILVLVLLAGLMLNLWLMLSTDYKQNFERYHNTLNSEHVTLAFSKQGEDVNEFLTETLKADSKTKEYYISEELQANVTFDYNGAEISINGVILDYDSLKNRTVGKIEIVEEDTSLSGIYLPMIYKSDEIAVGKTAEISVSGEKREYTVCGFFNSIMAGSHNCGMTQLLLTSDKYEELEKSGFAYPGTFASIRLNNVDDAESYSASIQKTVSEEYPEVTAISISYRAVEQARYISQGICSAIISAVAFLVLLITLVVIMSNISNYISENMKNLGALKALGYTGSQLIVSLVVQFSSVALIGGIVGTVLSYLLFPSLNTMMVAQTGIPYEVQFLPVCVAISLAIILVAVLAIVIVSARKIRKIEPITALRSGTKTHSFKKNHLPLEKTKASLNTALAFKTTFSNMKQNFVIAITMLMVSMLIVFSCLMCRNAVFDFTPMLNLIGGESADGAASVHYTAEDEFLKLMAEDDRVEKTYLFTSSFAVHGETSLQANIIEDSKDLNNQSAVYDGRYPVYDNELAIGGSYAKEKNIKIGDEIEISIGSKSDSYIITGFTQNANNLGKDCLITLDGYKKLGDLEFLSYYFNVPNTSDIEPVLDNIKTELDDKDVLTINQHSMLTSASSVYIILMTVIVVAIVILSIVIVLLVLYLLIKNLLNKKKQDYGILKALGFTTRQIVLQTAMSFMPAIVISLVAGLVVSCLTVNSLAYLFLGGLGIMEANFIVPYAMVAVVGVLIILASFGIACFLSRRVKKIAPRELLTNE